MAIKKKQEIYRFDEEQESLIAQFLERAAFDLPYFCKTILGIELHEGQVMAWDMTSKKYVPFNIYLCGNRAGKTVYISCKHIWKNFFKIVGPSKHVNPNHWDLMEYGTMNVAPHSETTKIIARTIMKILRGQFPIKDPDTGEVTTNNCLIRWFIDDESLNNPQDPPQQGPCEIHFANGATFKAFTMGGGHGDQIQGNAYAYGSYDEIGRSKSIDKEFVDVKTRLADLVGEFDMITTMDETNEDASDWLESKQEEALADKETWRIIQWDTTKNKYMDDESRRILLSGLRTDAQRKQVLSGLVVSKKKRYFPRENINAIFEVARPWPMVDLIGSMPLPGHKYWAGLDTAGKGKDQWALYVVDVTSPDKWQIVYSFVSDEDPKLNIQTTRDIIESFQKVCGQSFQWQMDYTSEGGTIVYSYLEDLNPIPYKFGIEKGSGRNMKHELMAKLRFVIQENLLSCDLELEASLHSQLTMYRGPENDKDRATDRVMALGLAVYKPYLDRLDESDDWIVDFD